MQFFMEIRKWLVEITEIALLLIALGVAAEILFGDKVSFFSGIVSNLTQLIGSLGDKGLVGLVSLGLIVFLFYRRRTAT